MILFHGSNQPIDHIDLAKSKKYKDFGTGFYLTTILDQAIERAIAVTKRYGGTPTVTSYEFDETQTQELNVKVFKELDAEWALFVVNNRNDKFIDFAEPLSNHDNKYDIVNGPIADDNVLKSINLYLDKYINEEALIERLRYREFNNQYSFHTEKSLKHLRKIDSRVYSKTPEQDLLISELETKMIYNLVEEKKLSVEKTMDLYYHTEISQKIEDTSTLFYKESASYLYELLKEELNKN